MIAGVDLGGTQVRIGFADDSGHIITTVRTRTATLSCPESLVDWVAGQAERHQHHGRLLSAGVGSPGPVDPKRGILVNPPNLPWQDVPLTAMMSQALGCPVHLENDANLAGLGEYHQGAGRGSSNLVYITWSTGVGCGLILEGRLYSGSHGVAGEAGHMIMEPSGPVCNCGQTGCLEAICGGGQILRRYGRPAEALLQAAQEGDVEAKTVVNHMTSTMGRALINLSNLIDPDLIVIGGGFTRLWRQLEPALSEVLASSPFIKPERRPKLRKAQLGDRVGTVGAVEWARAHV
jgi:glucokinase